MSSADDYLYHVTWYVNLDGIAEHGLVPEPESATMPYRSRGGYAAHSKGWVFYTEASGVIFWYGRYENFANDLADDPFEAGLVPVVLRVRENAFEEDELEEDELGTRDAASDAYKTKVTIEPEDIEIWDGSEWIKLEDSGDLDPNIAGDEDTFEDDEGVETTTLVFKSRNPLEPKFHGE